MALPSLHVDCSFAGGVGKQKEVVPIIRAPLWSEAPSSGVPTGNVAPNASGDLGEPIFHVLASADSWIAIGQNPDASAGPRRPAKAGVEYDITVRAGDKLAWIAA